MKKEKNLTMGYCAIQGFYCMLLNITVFASVYLLDCGFTNAQIGMIIAIAGILAAFVQPVVAGYADRPNSASLKIVVAVFLSVQIVLGILLFLTYQKAFFLTGFLYGCSVIIVLSLTPFINSLGMESMNQGRTLNFGVARGMGSIGYAIIAYGLGTLVDRAGVITVPIYLIIVPMMLAISLWLFPFKKVPKQAMETAKADDKGPIEFFQHYKRFGVVLVGCVFIYISHVLINNYNYQIVEQIGGGSAEMGRAAGFAAIIELPVMFSFAWMLKKVRCDIWFRISGIFFMLKTLGTLLAPNVTVYYAVQIFQMFGWALITVASVYYVNSIMEDRDAIKGQAYITMAYTIASFIGSMVGGALIDHSGVTSMLVFATVAAVIGMVIMLIATERSERDT